MDENTGSRMLEAALREDPARQLPIVNMGGKDFYRDDRLGQFRNVDNPHDSLKFTHPSVPKCVYCGTPATGFDVSCSTPGCEGETR